MNRVNDNNCVELDYYKKMQREEHKYRQELARRNIVDKLLRQIEVERTEKVNKLSKIPLDSVKCPRVAYLTK